MCVPYSHNLLQLMHSSVLHYISCLTQENRAMSTSALWGQFDSYATYNSPSSLPHCISVCHIWDVVSVAAVSSLLLRWNWGNLCRVLKLYVHFPLCSRLIDIEV